MSVPRVYNFIFAGWKMDLVNYLARIGVSGLGVSCDASSLKTLQRSHLLNVPFENLDIHWNRPILLETDRFYKKIVEEKRGGYCYELNGLFNELLKFVGFETRLVSGRVFNGSGHGPEFDHAAIIVTLGASEYLADVGFGDFTAEPLQIIVDEEQYDAAGIFLIRDFGDGYLEVAKRSGDSWQSEYIFRPIGRNLSEFSEMNKFQQTSPDSHFTKGKVCSLMTAQGRKTLTDKSFIVTTDGNKSDRPIESEAEFESILKQEFNIRRES